MKKLLLFIFSIFFWLIGFSNAYNFSFFNWDVRFISFSDYNFTVTFNVDPSLWLFVDSFWLISPYLNSSDDLCFSLYDDSWNLINTWSLIYSWSLTLWSTVWYYYWPINNIIKSWFYLTSSNCSWKSRLSYYLSNNSNNNWSIFFNSFNWFSYISSINFQYIFYDINYSFSSVSSVSDIKVNYNNWSFTNVSCDWVNEIIINWLSTQNSSTTFTPFFNISYIDEDNQNLIESYDKDLLYLSWWQYHKTYTWDNQWILNLVWWSSNTWWFNIISSWLVVSWDMVSDNLSWNMFKSFIDTWFTVLFSNVPSYIQYVILIVILIVILRIFTKKRRKF